MLQLRRHARSLVLAAALTSAPATAFGQLHDSDVMLAVHDGRITTNALAGSSLLAQRVFVADLSPATAAASEPGFDSAPGTFAAGTQIGLEFFGPLRRWNGANFDTPAPESLRLRLGPLMTWAPAATDFLPPNPPLPALPPAETDPATRAFGLSAADDGTYHRHFTFGVFASRSPLTIASTPGVFLMPLRLWSSDPAVAPSAPFLMILSLNADAADLAAATDFAQALLTSPPRCPADYNADGVLNTDDLSDFITDYFTVPPAPAAPGTAPPGGCPGAPAPFDAAGFKADFNRDCLLNTDDLSDFITAYFTGC